MQPTLFFYYGIVLCFYGVNVSLYKDKLGKWSPL